MKIYVNETEIEEIKKGKEVSVIYYSSPTSTPNCGAGTGNYGSSMKKEQSYISNEMYELIIKSGIKKVPTRFLDQLVWSKKIALETLRDYITLLEIFEKNKKEKHL